MYLSRLFVLMNEIILYIRPTPNDPCIGRTAPLASRRCILYTGWRTKCHAIDFARNTFLLL